MKQAPPEAPTSWGVSLLSLLTGSGFVLRCYMRISLRQGRIGASSESASIAL